VRRQAQRCPIEKTYRTTPSNTKGNIAEVTIRRRVFLLGSLRDECKETITFLELQITFSLLKHRWLRHNGEVH